MCNICNDYPNKVECHKCVHEVLAKFMYLLYQAVVMIKKCNIMAKGNPQSCENNNQQ